MATFPNITPQYSTQETVEQKSIRIALGDGYEQRLVQGLPANKRLITLNLTFSRQTPRSRQMWTLCPQGTFFVF